MENTGHCVRGEVEDFFFFFFSGTDLLTACALQLACDAQADPPPAIASSKLLRGADGLKKNDCSPLPRVL